jgi:hypothetical protein
MGAYLMKMEESENVGAAIIAPVGLYVNSFRMRRLRSTVSR